MKAKSFFIIAVFCVAAFATLFSCTNDGQKEIGQSMQNESARISDSTSKAIDKVRDQLVLETAELSASIQGGIDKIEMQIKETDSKMDKFTIREKTNWKIRKAKLEEKRDVLKADLEEVKKNSKREWNEFKDEWNAFKTKVGQSLQDVDEDLKDK